MVALLGVGGVALTTGSSGATGTLACPDFNDADVGTVPAGDVGMLFIGTQVSTATSDIHVTYNANGQTGLTATFPGVREGNSPGNATFHYIVFLPQGAVVTAATVDGDTGNTVVTVSGCLNGAPAPPVTTGAAGPPSVSPGGVQVSPESVTRAPTAAPSAAAAVTASPGFTG